MKTQVAFAGWLVVLGYFLPLACWADDQNVFPIKGRAGQVDSLMVEEGRRPFDVENRGLRFLTKLGIGTFSGLVFTGMTMGALDKIWEPRRGHDANTFRTIGLILAGSIVGCGVGFPFGVTSIDPYDSSLKTLLAGAIPGAVGLGVIIADQNREGTAALLMYVVPIISSLYASELSRKPPQASQHSRFSFGLAPALNGGLSAVAALRF